MNINKNPNTAASQQRDILAHLKDGRSLTSLGAFRQFGCNRLAARIHELKKTHDIQSEWVKTRNGKKVKSYFLSAQVCQPSDKEQS